MNSLSLASHYRSTYVNVMNKEVDEGKVMGNGSNDWDIMMDNQKHDVL